MRGAAAAIVTVLVLFVAVAGVADLLRPHERTTTRARRAALVQRLESEVTRYARSKVATHELDGPILRTRCLAFEDTDVSDPALRRGRYSCVAITFQTAANYSGHTFIGLVDYASGRIRFYRTGIPIWLGV
jgi:hypothetical protein